MPIWRIHPVADDTNARWLDHPVWEEVIVRAPTAADARVLAGEMERKIAAEAAPDGKSSLTFRSGFADEKLYWVERVETEPGPEPDGPDAILRAARPYFPQRT